MCVCKSGWIGEECKDPVYPWDADELRSFVNGKSVTSTTPLIASLIASNQFKVVDEHRNFQDFDTFVRFKIFFIFFSLIYHNNLFTTFNLVVSYLTLLRIIFFIFFPIRFKLKNVN